jgi:cytochrome c oxidase cbb3-type subunit III
MRRLGCMLLLCAGTLAAQHEYTPTDAEIGKGVYLNNCVYCHGPDGDQIAGIDFGHGRFKRVKTDQDLTKVILDGIDGTGMPAQNIRDRELVPLIAYLRSLTDAAAGTVSGDAARGKAVFEGKGACASCHRVGDHGSYSGPNLSDIGGQRRATELKKTLLDPASDLLPQNRYFHVVLKNGTSLTGRIYNQDTFTVQLLDNQQKLRTIPRTDLKEFSLVKNSPMPSYKDKLSAAELNDVVAYLVSLKGI